MRNLWLAAVGILVLGMVGCSISPEEKVGREQALKIMTENFANSVVQGNWSGVYGMTAGTFDSPEALESALKKSWVDGSTLTGGQIASMAWLNDKTAKVKLNWTFQVGSVQSFSSETFVWAWKGNTWKLLGRALR